MQVAGLELHIAPLKLTYLEARRPCRKAIRIMVASRWPQRLPLAAAISFSTSRSVRCSRGRMSALGRLDGMDRSTVRFSVAGDTSRSADLLLECYSPDV